MKRNIFTLIVVGIISFFMSDVNAQLVVYNGESVKPDWWPVGSVSEVGNHWSNPFQTGANTTASAATIWRNGGDDSWTGGGLNGLNIDVSYRRFTVMVYKEVEGNVQLELQDAGEAHKEWLNVWYGQPTGVWKQLEFVVPVGSQLGNVTTILVAPHNMNEKSNASFVGHRMYWDEVVAYSTPTSLELVLEPSSDVAFTNVYSITGVLVKEVSGDSGLDIASLPKGMYIIEQTFTNGAKTTKKLANY